LLLVLLRGEEVRLNLILNLILDLRTDNLRRAA
jgi:hypothetical protein